jgi:hypothetical protein
MWPVVYLPAAELERDELPAGERAALYNAVRKLESLGPALPYPHSSDVRGAASLRELRPRAGRSPWRALYRRVGERFVLAAIAPDGKSDARGFAAACEVAARRLKELEREEEEQD